MNYCKECGNILRSDNTIDYCRKHRMLSPIIKDFRKKYRDFTKEKRKNEWKNRSEEERIKFREENKLASKKYRDSNKEKRHEVCTAWRKNNPEKSNAIQKRSYTKRRKTPKGCLDHRMEVGIRNCIGNNKAGRRWEKLVGYTTQDLKTHIELLFTEGMSWEVFLTGAIHIDHIRPKTSFNYKTAEDPEFKECWGLHNLQPLWAVDNLSKGSKI